MTYLATVSYDSEPISLLDRNIERIAMTYCGDRCAGNFARHDHKHRRLAYSFETKAKRRRFIVAVERFLKTSNFREVTIE